MLNISTRGTATIALALAASLLASASMAGQLRTLDQVTGLAVGASVDLYSSPKRGGAYAMQFDTYEWRSAATGGSYQCKILQNATGKTLRLKLIGAAGGEIGACEAAHGATCSTPVVNLVGNVTFMCLLATDAFQAGISGFYRLAVSRVDGSLAPVTSLPSAELQAEGVAQ